MMKPKPVIAFLAAFSGTVLSLVAQPVFLGGPANPMTNTVTFAPGWSLIANPLFHNRGQFVSNAVPDNTIGELFPHMPNGTIFVKFDNATQRFAPRNTFRRGRWSKPNQTLLPGEGAYLFNPTRRPLHVTFTGDWTYGTVSLPDGLSLISSPGPGTIDFAPSTIPHGSVPPGPFASSGFQFDPQEGDAVFTFDGHSFVRHRFQDGEWDTLPVLDIGESCFVLTSHPRVIQFSGVLPLAPN